MRRPASVLLLACLALGPAPAHAGDGSRPRPLGALGPPILGVAAAGASTLSIVPANESGSLLWAAWDDGPAGHRTAHLALLRRAGRRVAAAWSVRRHDAYAPGVTTGLGWVFAGQPVAMLHYQFGAAYTQADLYGLAADGTPTALGRVEGALIEKVVADGRTTLRVHDTADLRGEPRCYGWRADARKLTRQGCGA